MSTAPQLLNDAIAHFNAGRVTDAESSLRKVLVDQPENPDALHLLGVVASRAGRAEVAVQLIGKAVHLSPKTGQFWSSLALVLAQQKRFDKAAEAAREAIAREPNNADAHYTLARALIGLNQPDAAVTELQTTLKLRPTLTDAWGSLGVLCFERKLWDAAIDAFERGTKQRPTDARMWSNLSTAYLHAAKPNEAVAAAQQAVLLDPENVGALSNLAQALVEAGHSEQAIIAAKEAIRLQPTSASAYINLGVACRAKGQIDDAIDAYQNAAKLDPNLAVAYTNLGNLYFALGRLDEALAAYDRSLEMAPGPLAYSSKLYAMVFHPAFDAAALLQAHRQYDEKYARPLAPLLPHHRNARTTGRRLKIGYVSPHFRSHVLAFNFMPVFREHDRKGFEIYCYSNLARGDSVTDQVKVLADYWRPIAGMSDQHAADLVRRDQIDILVDMTQHMGGNRLLMFAQKPAPVQVTFAGYPGSSGLSAMDWRLTDPYLDPPGTEGNFVERTLRLNDSYWVYESPAGGPAVGELPQKVNGYVTFGCLNGLNKVNVETMGLWMQVISQVPNSRLLLRAPRGKTRDILIAQLSDLCLSADRMLFTERLPHDQYLDQFNRVDITLDTLPYNGHTTSLDSLWMGVPVVTLLGPTVVGRAGWSQLSNLGLPELAALNEKQFVEIAVDLAKDPDRLAGIRGSLRERMLASPLCDAVRFTRNLETAYRTMWRDWVTS